MSAISKLRIFLVVSWLSRFSDKSDSLVTWVRTKVAIAPLGAVASCRLAAHVNSNPFKASR